MSPKARTGWWCAAAAGLGLALCPQRALAEEKLGAITSGEEEGVFEDPTPRLLSEVARVTLGIEPRVDGETLLGLSLSSSLGQGVPPFGDGMAFGLVGLEENVLSKGLGSLHLRTHLGIGFGSNRIYGISEQTLDCGVRIPFGTLPLGLYARAGLDVGAYGDSRLYTSRVTLPYGRVGVQWMGRRSMLEIGAAGGAVLVGRFNVGDDGSRTYAGTSEIGPTVLLTTPILQLSGELRRIGAERTGTGEPVVLARGMACGAMRGFGLGICMQVSYGVGDVLRREERTQVEATSFFGGMTVGYLVE